MVRRVDVETGEFRDAFQSVVLGRAHEVDEGGWGALKPPQGVLNRAARDWRRALFEGDWEVEALSVSRVGSLQNAL